MQWLDDFLTSCVALVVFSLQCLCYAAARREAGSRSAVPMPDSDDDDVIMEKEVDLDAVLERRRQEAILNGEMIDLAADVGDEQLQRWVHCPAALAVFFDGGRVRVVLAMPSSHNTLVIAPSAWKCLHQGPYCICSSCLASLAPANV